MDQFAAVLFAVVIFLFIVWSVCTNMLDKWRFRADRQYPYVRELMEEWETVTRRLLTARNAAVPDVSAAGAKHPWDAAAAVNRLAEACPVPDWDNPVTAPILGRQGELEEELETWLQVYNGLARSFNKALNRPVVKQMGKLLKWTSWEELNFNPHNTPKTDLSAK